MSKQCLLYSLLILLTPVFPLQAAPSPVQVVVGYLRDAQSVFLTLNGQKSEFRIFASEPTHLLEVEENMQYLARSLNRLSQGKAIQSHAIRPVFDGRNYVIHYGQSPILNITPTMARVFGKNRLTTLIELTNQLRKSLGAELLRSFHTLNPAAEGETGWASWYGGHFHGRRTANGEVYNIHQFTAAHKALPFGTRVLVTNLENRQSVVVKINDRGPFVPSRIIDLSPQAFKQIGYLGQGVLKVKLSVLS